MRAPAWQRGSPIRAEGAPPVLIAHGAGNSRQRLENALEAGAEFVEVDLWVHRGRFESRHERRVISPFPLLFDNWYLKFPPWRPFGLVDLLRAAQGRAGVLLDLKNNADAAAQLVRQALNRAGTGVPVVASSQSWPLLRRLRAACPEIGVLYSVDVRAKLELFRSVITGDSIPDGVSCRHTLLTPELVDEWKRRGLMVAAWTVDDPVRAAQLVSWGVDALTTTDPAALRERLTAAS